MGIIHKDVLVPSDKSCLEGCVAVDERFRTVCARYQKIWGVDLLVPESLRSDLFRWRQMISRYNKGDFRHTEAELRSLKAIAQWTVDVNSSLCNQPTIKIDWGN
jgi:hypothetical protein